MKHIGCFSGGKDSTALMLWMRENIGIPGKDWTPVFCDTGWEHPITYAYVEEINQQVLNGSLVRLKSEKYPGGFVQLCRERHGIPGEPNRFCTVELKIIPLHSYYASLDDEVIAYQGVRADESHARSCMGEDEYVDDAGGYTIKRPLLKWSATECFTFMATRGIKPNPLYRMGSSRVGCWDCVLIGLRELKRTATPELRHRLISLEATVNSETVVDGQKRKWPATFFSAGYIPARFCSLSQEIGCRTCGGRGSIEATDIRDREIAMFGRHSCNVDSTCCRPPCKRCRGTGKYRAYVPTAEDVFRYIDSVDEDQLPMLAARSCMSVYNLCE